MSLPSPTPKQARIIWLALTGLAVAALVLLAVALVWGLGQVLRILAPVIWPLALAGVIAYLLDPVVDFLEHRHVPRTRAIVVVFVCAVVLMLGIIGSVVPQIITETRDLAERVPTYAQRLHGRIQDWVSHPPKPLRRLFNRQFPPAQTDGLAPDSVVVPPSVVSTNAPAVAATETAEPSYWDKFFGTDTVKSAADWFAKTAPKVGTWAVSQVSRVASFFGLLAGLALVPVYAFYFLVEKRGIESHWADYLPVTSSGFKDEMVFVIKAINDHNATW